MKNKKNKILITLFIVIYTICVVLFRIHNQLWILGSIAAIYFTGWDIGLMIEREKNE